MKDVIAQARAKKEPSHVPVVTVEKRKATQKPHVDYSALTLEDLQKRYDRASLANDLTETQLLLFEAKKRGAQLKYAESAI